MLADLHVHTEYSHDSWAPVEDVLDKAEDRGLGAIAITDHDTIEGAKEASRLADGRDITVIPGVERTVPAGKHGVHLIGLYLEDLPPNDNAVSVVEAIHAQGRNRRRTHPLRTGTGLIDHANSGTVSPSVARSVVERADLIEVLNWKDSKSAISGTLDFVSESNHGIVTGTDAHTSSDVGKLVTRIDSADTLTTGNTAVVPVDDPTSVTVENLPEQLLARPTRSKDSVLRTQLVSTVAKLMGLVPGEEPNKTAKRTLRTARAKLELVSASHSGSSFRNSTVELSRGKKETDLTLDRIV